MTQPFGAIERRWREAGHGRGPPVSDAGVAAFEARYGVRLPEVVRAYFSMLNGSEDGQNGPMDDHLLAFWHLTEVRPVADEYPGRFAAATPYFVFADYSISVHAYAVRLSSDAGQAAPVAVIYDEFLLEVAPSFPAFLHGYVADDLEMLFPDPPAAWTEKYCHRSG